MRGTDEGHGEGTRHSGTATKEGLRDDLERFAFLLGGSDGEPLFSPRRLT